MKIAIFGGSFDPLHNGHLKIIQEAIKKLDIDRLLVVPTFLNPFKKESFLSPQKRLEQFERYSFDKRVQISDYEIIQAKATPTVQTIKYYNALLSPSKIYLIIGADNLSSLNRWQDYHDICNMAEFVVATRDSIDTKGYKTLQIDIDISSTQLREAKPLVEIL